MVKTEGASRYFKSNCWNDVAVSSAPFRIMRLGPRKSDITD